MGRQMTPAEYEWADEQAQLAYERDQIDVVEFRRRLKVLGFSDAYCTELISDLDRLKAAHPYQQREPENTK